MSTQTEFVPKRPKLPQELFDLIVDFSRDNKPTLQELSLVCRSFCQQARCYMFSDIHVICELPGETYKEDNPCDYRKMLSIDKFVRLCESPHSTWNPRVVKNLEIWPRLCDSYARLLWLSASDHPGTPYDSTVTKLDIPRTRDIFRGLVGLQLSFGDFGHLNHIEITPSEFISTTFPSIRRLSLKYARFPAVNVWNIFLSMPLLEEFEWICGVSWSPSSIVVNAGQQLPKLRSFSYEGSNNTDLRDIMPVLSHLPKSHLRRYEFRHLSYIYDFPEILALMTIAGSDGPANQQWSFAFAPNAARRRGAYNPRLTDDCDFIVGHLSLSRNSRISELTFANGFGWPIISEVLKRFVKLSSSKSNLKSIVLPPFQVGQGSEDSYVLSELEKIDEILDHDAFSGLQELHFHSFLCPKSNGKASPDTTQPLDGKPRNARWGEYEPVLEEIEEQCVSRAVKRGVWKLHTSMMIDEIRRKVQERARQRRKIVRKRIPGVNPSRSGL